MSSPIVILGSGLAGFGIARALRRLNSECEIVMICADSGDSYSKPQLSTALAAKKTAQNLVQQSSLSIAVQLNIKIISNTEIVKIDTRKSYLYTNTCEEVHYSKLVLALGSSARKLSVKGNGKDNVLSVNSLNDYHNFQTTLQDKKEVVVIGGGLIGCEFTNDLLVAGYKVRLVEPCAALLNSLVPKQVGTKLQQVFEDEGAQVHLGRCAIEVNSSAIGLNVLLDNGEQIHADLVLSAIGVEPNVNLAYWAGIRVNHGIVVDRYLRTSVPNIFAIGDCAELEGRVLPYIAPILAGSKALASTLLGEETAVIYGPMPVLIKTTLFPLVTSPVPLGANGHWNIEIREAGIKALFEKENGELVGMALGGDAVKERAGLVRKLPSLMSE